jgi:hypothetical protein
MNSIEKIAASEQEIDADGCYVFTNDDLVMIIEETKA